MRNQIEFHIDDTVNYHSYPVYKGGRIESTGHKIVKIQSARPNIDDTSVLATLDNGAIVYIDYLSHVDENSDNLLPSQHNPAS